VHAQDRAPRVPLEPERRARGGWGGLGAGSHGAGSGDVEATMSNLRADRSFDQV
jgi:hypothetical protein